MDIELCRKIFSSQRGGRIFVGFSGGADSTAALLTALRFRSEYGFQLTAVHFDHHLRGAESDADAAFCRRFAEERGIDIEVIDLKIDTSSCGSLEEKARAARLARWKMLAGDRPGCAVVLGHHADDRIENFLLRLLRGSNLSGLLSPRAVCDVGGVRFLRPLLPFPRREIELFLQENGIRDWRTDSTNAVSDCARNALRNDILPVMYGFFGGAQEGARRCLESLELDADFLDSAAGAAFDRGRVNERDFWKKLHPALVPRVIRLWKNAVPSGDFLRRLRQELLRSAPAGRRSLPWSDTEFLVFEKASVYWAEKAQTTALPVLRWDITDGGSVVWGDWRFCAAPTGDTCVASKYEAVFDAEALGDVLLIAPALPGDRMRVFGTGKNLKIQKLRIDAKVPSHPVLPVVKNAAGEILWAPGIRHGAIAAVTGGTKRKIRLQCVQRSSASVSGSTSRNSS